METTTIYVELLDEGTMCWRPVPARILPDGVYEILDCHPPDDPFDETPAFEVGDRVYVEKKVFSGGSAGLVAVRRAE